MFENSNNNIAVVFGSESCGLTNSQLDLCNMIMTIPTSSIYSSLNLSVAVAIFCYELKNQLDNSSIDSNKKIPVLPTNKDMESYFARMDDFMQFIQMPEDKPRINLLRRLRKIFFKANLDASELALLQGILTHLMTKKK